jgi:hypothetical protein
MQKGSLRADEFEKLPCEKPYISRQRAVRAERAVFSDEKQKRCL